MGQNLTAIIGIYEDLTEEAANIGLGINSHNYEDNRWKSIKCNTQKTRLSKSRLSENPVYLNTFLVNFKNT